MRVIAFLLFLALPMNVFASRYLDQIAAEQAVPLPDCTGLSERANELCGTIRKAQAIARQCELSVYPSGKVLMREFCIVAYEPDSKEFHTILLEMPVAAPKGFQPHVKRGPYEVIRTDGTSFIKFRFEIFEAYEDGRRLYAYAAKHLSIPPGTDLSNRASVEKHAVPIVYLAADEHLLDKELAKKGLALKREAIDAIRFKIGLLPSRARPLKSVGDIASTRFLLGLSVAEQTDQDAYFGDKNWSGYDTHYSDPLENKAVQSVGVTVFINGITAYSQIHSKAGACGSWQFIQSTYADVRRKYPDAPLDPDYRRGCQGFTNLGSGALLLIDLEFAGSSRIVHTHFDRDHDLFALAIAAKYNGGPQRGEYLARFIDTYERTRKVQLTVKTFPWSEFRQAVRRDGKKKFPWETLGYVRKIADLLELENHLGK